jgi:hypothetical protein
MTYEHGSTGTLESSVQSDCCQCEDDLPALPYTALRVAYGMLLSEDDFRVLMANPRGKQMLTAAWLHGSGVVWGYQVRREGTDKLTVSPGLAVDGIGRLCAQDSSSSVGLSAWVDKNVNRDDGDCGTETIHACLTVEFSCCRTHPVPTLSDPCDVTRKHDDFSRVVETSYLSLHRGNCPCPDPPYHRTRVLLGIDEPGRHDPAGEEALAARRRVAETPDDERPQALLAEFRRMTVLDSAYMKPAEEATGATLFPVLPEHAPVVLACLEIEVKRNDGCVEIGCVEIGPCCRRALLPTTTIQELLCGLAPSLVDGGDDPVGDAGGPRIRRESVKWTHGGTRLRFSVTAPLNTSTIRDAVHITSLRDRGWEDEDVVDVDCHDGYQVEIELADAPDCEIVRLIVKGTGAWPVFGVDPPVPLAGLVGGPPGTADDGVDVVLTFTSGPGGLEETT